MIDLYKLNRYALYLKSCGTDIIYSDDIFWISSDGFYTPAYLPHINLSLNTKNVKQLLLNWKFSFLRWTSDFDSLDRSDWWFVVRKGKYLEAELSSKTRNQIRRGLKNFSVRKILPSELIDSGYKICEKAVSHYEDKSFLPEKLNFNTRVLVAEDFLDVVDYFGVFSGDDLIGFSENIKQGNAVWFSNIWFDYAYIKQYPSYALMHTMLDHYLNKLSYNYVSDGSRSIYHQTNIQNHLIDKFLFVRAYSKINLIYSVPMKVLVQILILFKIPLYFFTNIFNSTFLRKLNALATQELIRRSQPWV